MKRSPIQRRTPMRRDGPSFSREDKPTARSQVPEDREARRQRSVCVLLASTSTRRVEMGGTTTGVPIHKEDASQSGSYMAAAKGLGYCMRCGRPTTGPGGLDFCHADLGKGQGIKTDVRRGWPGCRDCHEAVGRELARPVRRAVELLLGVMTRSAVREAGTWPAKLAVWE